MLLTSTADILYTEVIPVFTGIISVGIITRLAEKGKAAQEDEVPLTEYLKKVKKLVVAAIISITATIIIPVIASYYM